MVTYPENSILIKKVSNGFILDEKGSRENQEDNLDKRYVFNNIDDLIVWLRENISIR